jgi:hypothetical protein
MYVTAEYFNDMLNLWSKIEPIYDSSRSTACNLRFPLSPPSMAMELLQFLTVFGNSLII